MLSGEHLFHDGSNISSIVYPSVIGTQPNQAQRLYRLLKSFRSIVVQACMPCPGIEMWHAFEQGRAPSKASIALELSCIIVTP